MRFIPFILVISLFAQDGDNAPAKSGTFDFTPTARTIWGYHIGIEVSSGVMLMYRARTTYISDLEIEGEFIPVESIQIETQVIF